VTARRRPIIVAGAVAAMLFVALVAGLLAALAGDGGSHGTRPEASPTTTPADRTSLSATGFTPVPPLTDTPAQTPVQEQYDAALASGLASSSSVEIAEAAQVPAPAYSADWPTLPVEDTPEAWVEAFTNELLSVDFARQPRAGLGAWLSAEEAPELLPGVPQEIQDRVCYLSLFDANALGNGPSPVPDQPTWNSYAQAGTRWTVSNLLVQPDPTFSQIVGSGWQPIDQRFGAWDVSGLLITSTGTASVQRHFTMTVYVGSAHWHPGYGTVLVDNWKET
jgi:hypothetical protein